MSDRRPPYHDRAIACWSPLWLAGFGVLSILIFSVPIAGPLIQAMTLIQSLRAARWGVAQGWGLTFGIGGALVGFCLSLARGHLGG